MRAASRSCCAWQSHKCCNSSTSPLACPHNQQMAPDRHYNLLCLLLSYHPSRNIYLPRLHPIRLRSTVLSSWCRNLFTLPPRSLQQFYFMSRSVELCCHHLDPLFKHPTLPAAPIRCLHTIECLFNSQTSTALSPELLRAPTMIGIDAPRYRDLQPSCCPLPLFLPRSLRTVRTPQLPHNSGQPTASRLLGAVTLLSQVAELFLQLRGPVF